MAAPVLAGIAIAGLAVSIYGQIKAANDKAEALERDAQLKNMEAEEMSARALINEQLMRDKAIFDSGSAAAWAGESGTGNLGIGAIIRIRARTDAAIAAQRREVAYKAKMLRMGAEIDTKLAGDVMTTGYIGASGTALTGAAKVYDALSPPSSNSPNIAGPGNYNEPGYRPSYSVPGFGSKE